jgi:hypothetical protein
VSLLVLPGYNGAGEWDDYSKYLNPEGVDMVSVSIPGWLVVVSNGSVIRCLVELLF